MIATICDVEYLHVFIWCERQEVVFGETDKFNRSDTRFALPAIRNHARDSSTGPSAFVAEVLQGFLR